MIPFLLSPPWASLPASSLTPEEQAQLTELSNFYLHELMQEPNPKWPQPHFEHSFARQIAEAILLHTRQLRTYFEKDKSVDIQACLPQGLSTDHASFLTQWLQERQRPFEPLDPHVQPLPIGPTNPSEGVNESVSDYLTVLTHLKPHYDKAVEEGLFKLKYTFLQDYQRSQFPLFERDRYLQNLSQLFRPEQPKGGAAWGLGPEQVNKLRQEITLLTPSYQPQALLQRRSPHELQDRLQGPFFETEAFLQFHNWLYESDFKEAEVQRILNRRSPEENTPLRWRSLSVTEDLGLLYRELGSLLGEGISFQDFHAHFSHPDQPRLIWRGSQVLLMYLFDQLKTTGFLPSFSQKGMAQSVAEHFLSKSGDTLKPDSLEAALSRLKLPPKHHERIDSIIEQLQEQTRS